MSSLYREYDYAFGQLIVTLRSAIGVTQSGLAELLDMSRQAVSGWELGQSYPKSDRLKAFIALAVHHHAFPAGREAEQIRSLWRAAHQKVLLDEQWLRNLLHQQAPLTPVERTHISAKMGTSPAPPEPRLDWGDALDVPTFYGREEELALLVAWIVEERCRVVSVLGMGGIGKSAVATHVMRQVADQFDTVIWRSLRDSPACEDLIDDCLQVLAPQALPEMGTPFERRFQLLTEQLRAQRVLLVLDNGEVLLGEGTSAGRMRPGFEAYDRLLQQIGTTIHQSCLVLTSREKPAALAPLEGRTAPVRIIHLRGLDAQAGIALLEEKDVLSSPPERARLVETYQGNPLALKIVGQTIVELFGGEIGLFLEQGEVIFGGVRELLDQQFMRLAPLEQTVLLWLAILRDPVSFRELLRVLSLPRPMGDVLEAVEGLRRRSLIEQGQRVGSFTLQSVVLEYATARLIAEARDEIEQGKLVRLITHGLCLAQAKEYMRQAQEQVLVAPLLIMVQSTYHGQAALEARLLGLLDRLRGQDQAAQGYGPANLVALLGMLRGDLRDLDLSRLVLRNVFLQGVEMQDADLSGAVLQDSVFTEPLDAILTVATNRTGAYWAAATRQGEIRIWEADGRVLRHTWRSHTDLIWSIAFSPKECLLALASADGMINVWDVHSGTLLWESKLDTGMSCLAFSSDGKVLAGGGANAPIRLWDADWGTPLAVLPQPSGVLSLAWSPDGQLLASGCADGNILLWQLDVPKPDTPVQVLAAHTQWVTGLAFSPDGTQLASASFDGTVKRWDVPTRACLQTFAEHTDPVNRVVWSPDGRTLASCGDDATIWFWDVEHGRASRVLQGYTGVVLSLAFTPDSHALLSGGYDGALRVWDVEHGQCLRIIGGYSTLLRDIDWSPDGRQLASVGDDMLVTLWDTCSATPPSVVQGHCGQPRGVAWSPDGRLLASGGRDGIEVWDTVTRVRLYELCDPDVPSTTFQGVTWRPDGRFLACGSYLRGVQVWEISTRIRRWVGQAQATRIRRVAWSPDGCLLAGGGFDGITYVWDGNDGTPRQQLIGHTGVVVHVAWKPDATRLASCGGGGSKGAQLFVWDVQSGERVQALTGDAEWISAVAWHPNGNVLISGDSDGKLHWWNVEGGQLLRVQHGHEGMVRALKLSPDGSTLASCGDDGLIQLWDLHAGELIRTLRGDRLYERLDITHIRGLSDAQKTSLHALGAVERGLDDPQTSSDETSPDHVGAQVEEIPRESRHSI